MTLVSQIITDAFRQSNLLSINSSVTVTAQTEALRFLNRLVKSVMGHEAGERLEPMAIGFNHIDDSTDLENVLIPVNARMILNLTEETTVLLYPQPDDGTRMGLVDVSGNLSTYNFILDGNGRLIEGATTLTLDTDSLQREWFYREDLGNWVRYTTLDVDSEFPFPDEFDDFFISMLALRLNPAYGASIDPQSQAIMQRAQSQLRSRYNIISETPAELALLLLKGWGSNRTFFSNSTDFDHG